jgi:hypothetical protein
VEALTAAVAAGDDAAESPPAVAADTAPHDRARAVTPDGTSHNRIGATSNGAGPQTRRNSPAADRAQAKNRPELLPGAGPRAARELAPQPAPRSCPRGSAAATAGTAPAVEPSPRRSPATADSTAADATAGLPRDTPHDNNDFADESADTTARTHEASSADAGTDARSPMPLARPRDIRNTGAGPREVKLPKVKSRRRGEAPSETLYLSLQRLSKLPHRLMTCHLVAHRTSDIVLRTNSTRPSPPRPGRC